MFSVELYSESEKFNVNNLPDYFPDSSWVRSVCTSGDRYSEICDHYGTNRWLPLHPFYSTDYLVRIPLSESDLSSLKRIGQIRCSSGRDLRSDDIEDFSDELISQLNKAVFKLGKVFVRMTHKSTKNSFSRKLCFCSTVLDILDSLTSSIPLLKTLNSPFQEIILMKWVIIDPKTEYRVFIIDYKLVGISQQHCYTTFGPRDVLPDAEKILEWYQSVRDKFIELNYSIATLDLYVNEKVNLIEVNPPSLWGPSGSSLFTEKEMVDLPSRDYITVKIR